MISKKKKKKVFAKIQSDFSAEIQNSNVFSAQNQVISKKKKGLRQNSERFLGRNPKFKRFFRPKSSDLQKKKKKKKKRLRQISEWFFGRNPKFKRFFFKAIFLPKFRKFKRFRGGYFQFFTENRPQKHKKHAILHTSQANGGARAPPPPPWLRYWL